MLKPEWLVILHELESPDELQKLLAAVYLFTNLPVYELAHCTPKQIDKIAAPVKSPNA